LGTLSREAAALSKIVATLNCVDKSRNLGRISLAIGVDRDDNLPDSTLDAELQRVPLPETRLI
jgi:hypothetical protein